MLQPSRCYSSRPTYGFATRPIQHSQRPSGRRLWRFPLRVDLPATSQPPILTLWQRLRLIFGGIRNVKSAKDKIFAHPVRSGVLTLVLDYVVPYLLNDRRTILS